MPIAEPVPHPDHWVNHPSGYIKGIIGHLITTGFVIDRAWMDPCQPRDATLVLSDLRAITWDEDRGLLLGRYVSGHQGERTVLADPVQLSKRILMEPAAVPAAVRAGRGTKPTQLRSHGTRDGLDEALDRFI
jgi:hypothetical protein